MCPSYIPQQSCMTMTTNEQIDSISNDIASQIEQLSREWINLNKDLDFGKVILYNGKVISLLNFQPQDFDPEHCFNILPHINRYNGNSYIQFDVGKHSLLCYKLARLFYPEYRQIQLACLTHDYSEGVTGDCISPIKHLPIMSPFRLIENSIEEVIQKVLNLNFDEIILNYRDSESHKSLGEYVKLIDKLSMSIEVRNLNKYGKIEKRKNYIFSFVEIKKIFKQHFAEYSDSLIDDLLNLTPTRTEVKLRNTFTELTEK